MCAYLFIYCILLWFSVRYSAAAHREICGVNALRGKLYQLVVRVLFIDIEIFIDSRYICRYQ